MATQKINTRIKNKIDSLESWVASNPILLNGEIAIIKVATESTFVNSVTGQTETAYELLMKIGNGTAPFDQLPWLSSKASDVFDWAKLENAGDVPITILVGSTETSSTLGAWLKSINDKATTNASNISSVSAKVDVAKVSTAISTAINALDSTTSGSGNFVKAVTQTNGVVAVTKGSIAASDIPELATSKIVVTAASGDVAKETLDTRLAAIDADITALEGRQVGHTDAQINTLITNKINALDFSEPADSTATAADTIFIDSISQTNGKITATKKKLPEASADVAGITKLGKTGGAATFDAVNTLITATIPELDAKVVTNTNKLDGVTKVTTSITNAINALDVSEPTASGTSTSFIATAKQVDGKISVTKKSLPDATDSTAGIVKLGVSGGAASHDSLELLADRVEEAEADIVTLQTAVAGGVHFIGTVMPATPISDGSTTNPVIIVNKQHTAVAGDVVLYNNKEFIWTGSAWEELGDLTRVGALETIVAQMANTDTAVASQFVTAVKQSAGKITVSRAQPTSADVKHDDTTVSAALASQSSKITAVESKLDGVTKVTTSITNAINALDVSEPTASGTATSFIATAKQTDGKIVVTKKNLPTATDEVAGIVKLGATGGAAAYDVVDTLANTTVKNLSADVAANVAKLTGITTTVTDAISATVNALDYTSPSASATTATTFIDTVSQSNGKISATKKTLPTASTSVSGIVKLSSSTSGTSEATAATTKAVSTAYSTATDAQSRAMAMESNYVRFNSTDQKLYIGTGGASEIIFDCGGADI